MNPFRRSHNAHGEPAPRHAKRVLVIQLGDVALFVQALAAAKAIRDYHVGARVTLLTTEALKPFAQACPYFDVVESDGGPLAGVAPAAKAEAASTAIEPPKLVQTIAHVRSGKFDMIYDLEGSKRTAALFAGLKPWPPSWSGPVSNCSHPFADRDRERTHALDRYAAQLQGAGVLAANEALMPDLSWLRGALRDPPRLKPDYFGVRGPYVLLLPRGEGANGRCWPEEKYADIARRLAGQGVTPVVLGGPEERNTGAAIARAEPKAKNLVTRADLFQCAGLAERAAYALGDDVDLMQVAAAAGAPCLVFLSAHVSADRAPRGAGGVVSFTAAAIADLPVEQVERQLRNSGVLHAERATA